jgi:hypothetical protein
VLYSQCYNTKNNYEIEQKPENDASAYKPRCGVYRGERISWTSEPRRLHRSLCRQPRGLKAVVLQRGIPYEDSRDRSS